jgi:hypothetical protein
MLLPYYWGDYIEIFIVSIIFYYIALWLAKDRQQNLLWYFYAYCGLTILAYSINLYALSLFFLFCAPIVMTLFIIAHQETLQRNIIALKNIAPAQARSDDWLDNLLRSCLGAAHNNTSITCVIEHNDNLQDFLQAELSINAHLQKNILDIILASDIYNDHLMIWVNTQGILRAINAQWRTVKSDIEHTHDWQDYAHIYTAKTDALVFQLNHKNRLFTIIAHNDTSDSLRPEQAHTFIKKQYNIKSISLKKGDAHGSFINQDREKRPTA